MKVSSIKDVAKLAGVSYTTVSHVINGTRRVHPDTEKRVREAIEQSGFTPSCAARALRCGKSRSIGIIDSAPSDLFFMEVMHYTQRVFDDEGYNLYYSFSETHENEFDVYGEDSPGFQYNCRKEIEYIEQMVKRDVEAIIINPISSDSDISAAIASANVPFIMFQRSFPGLAVSSVVSDDYAGGYRAIDYLVSLGHRKIAVVHGCGYESHTLQKRHEGVRAAMRAHCIELPENYCIGTSFLPEEAYAATLRLLEIPQRPSAIFYFSDIMAFAGVRAAHDRGLRVPADISIIGYDDIHLCNYMVPRLTTINQDKRQLGTQLARTTLACIEQGRGGLSPEPLAVTLVERESCAKY